MKNKKTTLFFMISIISILAIIVILLHYFSFPESAVPYSVESSVIEIDPLDSKYYVDDTFTVSGNTTFAKDGEIRVHFYLNYYIHGIKARPDNISRDVAAQILPGKSGLNRWSATIDTTGFWPDEYIITAYANNQEINTSRTVLLINKNKNGEIS